MGRSAYGYLQCAKLRQGEAQGDGVGDVRAGPPHLGESGKTSVMNDV